MAILFVGSFFLPDSTHNLYGSASFKISKHLKWWNKGFVIKLRRLSKKLSFRHMILVAPSGSGKTQLVLLRNNFILPQDYSCVISDPKLELFGLSSGYCQDVLGCKVFVLNLGNPQQSAKWNPFSHVNIDEVEGLVTDIYEIVNAKEAEAIWKFGSIGLIVLVVKILIYYQERDYANFANIIHFLNHIQVYPDLVRVWINENIDNEELCLAYEQFLNTEEKIRQGILIGAINSILPYCSETIKKISTTTTLPNILSIRRKRTVIYLGMPVSSDRSFAPYITLFLSRFFGDLMKTKVKRNDLAIACILEEFGNLKSIYAYPQLIATIRDKNVMLLHCLQNLDQLEYVYDKHGAEIIANNCASWLILHSIKSERTLRYITESLLGSTTISTGKDRNGQEKRVSRPLMTKDEVRRLKANHGIFISGNEQPEKIKLKPLYKSWWLRRKFGLKNVGGRLEVSIPPTAT